MVFGTLLCRRSKAILRIGLSLSSLRPINPWPLLFIIYINDLLNVSSLTQSLLFADDTNISCSHRNTNHLVSIANNELAKLVIWLKAKTKTNFIAKSRYYLSSKSLLTLYYSLVYPYLTYRNVAWSSAYCSNLNCIYLLQKRIVRLISKAHYLANTAPLFSKLEVLDIYSINSFSVATFMYPYHHNLLPSSFRNLFLSSYQVHHYETRLPLSIDLIFVELVQYPLSRTNNLEFFASYTNQLLFHICFLKKSVKLSH